MVRSIFPQNTRNTQKFLQGVQQSLLHRPSSVFSYRLHSKFAEEYDAVA